MRTLLTLLASILQLHFSFSQVSLYLIGDAGKDTFCCQSLALLREELKQHPSASVVFLGDNVYPSGLNINSAKDKARLSRQLESVKNINGSAFFIPGNHDWKSGKCAGYNYVLNQADFVNKYLRDSTTVANRTNGGFFPQKGLPGPYSVLVGEKVRLVLIDTDWWLHQRFMHKVGLEAEGRKATEEKFFRRLDSILALSKANGERVVLAAHHPMYASGEHAKLRQPWRFLNNYTPFKLFGLFGLDRLYRQDIPQPCYQRMRQKVLNAITDYPDVIYVSGHEHNLQYLKIGNLHCVVSGAGSKHSKIKKQKYPDSFWDCTHFGFFRIDFLAEGRIVLTVYRAGMKPETVDTF